MSDLHLDGEIVAEEDASPRDATEPVRTLPAPYEKPTSSLPVLRADVRTAAIAAAVRAVSAVSSKSRSPRRASRRRNDRGNVVASRSFLVDVHLLGR